MTPIKRGGVFYLYVARQKGGVVRKSTGTSEKRLYTLMKALLARLKADRRWPLLNAIVDGRLSIGQVFDADRVRGLDALEASLSAQSLRPLMGAYLESARARGLAPRNVENLDRQLASFWQFRTPCTTSDLTTATVTAWLASLTTSPGTRRQYLYAVTGFARYLVDVGVLADYPLSRVKAPKKNHPRMTYVDAAADEKIVQAASSQYRALFAFIKGTGCDVTTALNLSRQDVDLAAGTVRLRGTKTMQRDVHKALIEPWAIPYLRDYCRAFLYVNVRMWPGATRSGAYHHHQRCCAALGVEGYTLKDSRHSVAVRMMEAGYNVQEIAEQLGTSPELVARVYSRFAPKMDRRVPSHVPEANHG